MYIIYAHLVSPPDGVSAPVVAPSSSPESQPSIASIISESSPPSSSMANLSYSPLANRSHSLHTKVNEMISYLRVVREFGNLVLYGE
jgi:hypothetical protein